MTEERLAQFMEAWNTRDVDAIVGAFMDDGVFYASVGTELMGATSVGRDAIRRGVEAFFERFPTGRFEDTTLVVAGDHGSAEWTFVVTGPDGQDVPTRGCDLFEFEGEKIRVKNAFRKAKPT
jgi:ketosteroid isomerase-like protein